VNIEHKKILFVNDKEYALDGTKLTCAVNYNMLFEPLVGKVDEIHIAGRFNPSVRRLAFAVDNVVFHGLPMYKNLVEFVFNWKFGRKVLLARNVLESVIAGVDVVFLTLGCAFATEVDRICSKLDKPLVVEVIDDVISAVKDTKKYRGIIRLVAFAVARYYDSLYHELCARNPSLILGQHLYNRYRPQKALSCIEFFENLVESDDVILRNNHFRGSVKLLYVGRIVPMKSLHTLLEAVHILVHRGLDITCRIVGYGECLGQLQQKVAELEILDKVEFKDFVPFGHELFLHYDWADIFVLPSAGGEGVPRVLLEAMSRSTIVVASRVCGIPTVIRDGENGLLVDPQRADKVADAVLKIAMDKHLQDRLIRGAYRFATENTRSARATVIYEFLKEAIGWYQEQRIET